LRLGQRFARAENALVRDVLGPFGTPMPNGVPLDDAVTACVADEIRAKGK